MIRTCRFVLLALVVWLAVAGRVALGQTPAATAPPGPAVQAPESLPSLGYALTTLEERLFADAAQGRLRQFSLFEAALVASGVDDPRTLKQYRRQQDEWIEALRREAAVPGAGRQQAQAIFEFLHRRVLTGGYCLECTDLRQAIDHGRFNCLSASVLFNCLAGALGLDVCGLEKPGHTMSRLRLPQGPLDIESTCPRWFQLPAASQKSCETRATAPGGNSQRTGQSATSSGDGGREVSDIEMVAMIYYNRGVRLPGRKTLCRSGCGQCQGDPPGSPQRRRPREPPGDAEQLGDRAGRQPPLRRGSPALAAGPGDRARLRGLPPELRPPLSAAGRSAVASPPLGPIAALPLSASAAPVLLSLPVALRVLAGRV